MKRPIILIILDGWGIGRNDDSNPIHVAAPATFKWLTEHYPVTSLQASGISVGLPWGEVGNSEVGHLTLGAGKVLYQYFPKITLAIREGAFFQNPAFASAFTHAKQNNSAVNLVGLLTTGNVHAAMDHLQALLKMAEQSGVTNIKLHLFTDGRDSPPRSAESLILKLPQDKISTLIGRYYAMDRGNRWTLTQRAYACLTGGPAESAATTQEALDRTYKENRTEEYLPPTRLANRPVIEDNDAVIFFNFREDSMRQLTDAFFVKDFTQFPTNVMQFKNLFIATMTPYRSEEISPVAFQPDTIQTSLGKVLADAGKTQLRLAETYKYAHVTYFFNGYREMPYTGEFRVIIPSDPMPHPDEHPAMRASTITDRLLQTIGEKSFDFILVNYANADTIAHTGNYDAGIETVKIMDAEVARIVKTVKETDTMLIITSDHGNIEEMLNPQTGLSETAHDPSPVPFYLVAKEFEGRNFMNQENLLSEVGGTLADVAPTVLELMGIPIPKEMTGKSVLRELL